METERDIERALCRVVERHRGRCLKWVSPGHPGVPDRIVLLPGGVICFVEVKKPGGQIRPLQRAWKAELERLGFKHRYVTDRADLINFETDVIMWTEE